MTYRVGPKGQVVIPKTIRDQLDIQPGDEVDVERRKAEVVIRRHRVSADERRQRIVELRGALGPGARGGAAALEESRREEREREQRKDQGRLDHRP